LSSFNLFKTTTGDSGRRWKLLNDIQFPEKRGGARNS